MYLRAILLVVASLPLLAQAPKPGTDPLRYALTTEDATRVRGGPGDTHAILERLPKGSVVRVVEDSGEWRRIELPAGVPAWVQGGVATPSLKESAPGEAVCAVEGLVLRGSSNRDFPGVGTLSVGDRVRVLEKRGEWMRVLAPRKVRSWIHSRSLDAPRADEALGKKFDENAKSREQAWFGPGSAASAPNELERRQLAADSFKSYAEELRKAPEERNVAPLRKTLEAVRNEAPVGSADRERADKLLATLAEWERLRAEFERLKERESRSSIAKEEKLAEELANRIKEREKKARGQGEADKTPSGWIRRSVPGRSVIEPGAVYALWQGSVRQYVLESERYDLGDYTNAGMLIRVLEFEGPFDRKSVGVPVLRVTRMEIVRPRYRKD